MENARFKSLKDKEIKKQESIERLVENYMKDQEINIITLDKFNLYFTKSVSAIVSDQSLLNSEYLTIKTTETPDKMKIRSDIKK